ncbi:MAG: hypothetical protein HIU84_11905 [Acidobacteria bacterium]|nr:hypothetical protein [Acidobacteriota bacterium]
MIAATSQEITVRELAAKMSDDGSMNVQIVDGEEGISHPDIRILAATALSLLELDGTAPPYYCTAEFSGRLASGETNFVEIATCKSKNQTPHLLRMKAETERDRLCTTVGRLEETRAAAHEFAQVRAESDWDHIRDILA